MDTITYLNHLATDFSLFFSYIWENLWSIFSVLLDFYNYAISFISGVISQFQAQSIEPFYTFSDNIIEIFEALPHWSIISTTLGASIMFIILLSTIKLFSKI